MREGQRVNYAERIERAVRLIEQSASAGEAPSLASLSAAAAMSEYHFHRVFRLMTGESPAEAVTRVRLGHSLPALASGISAATGRSGYATSQAYARAVRAKAGATPGELRDDAERRAALAEQLARPHAAGEGTALTIEVASFEPLRLLTLRNVGAYEELNIGYGQLFELILEQIGSEAITGIYGLPLDDPRHTEPSACRFICGLDTGSAGMACGELSEMTIPGGRHALLALRGDYERIHSEIDRLYEWAIACGEPVSSAALFVHYLDDPDEVPPQDQRAVACLPLA